MSLHSLPIPARLAAAACALGLLACGGLPEDEAAEAAVAPQPAALGGGPVRTEGQGPFIGASTGTDVLTLDRLPPLAKPSLNGCAAAQRNPTILCDPATSRWLPRTQPGR